jgi:RNA polymerase sigma factor (sigma-70 family)
LGAVGIRSSVEQRATESSALNRSLDPPETPGADDRDAVFESVLHAEWSVLVKIAQKLASRPDEVNDILQEATTRTYAAWRRGKIEHLPRYLTVVVRHTAFGLRRRHRSEAIGLERLVATDRHSTSREQAHPGDGALDRRDEVREAFQKLPPMCQEILELRIIDEWPVSEIASRLYIADGTVKSRCHRCLKQLSRLLQT